MRAMDIARSSNDITTPLPNAMGDGGILANIGKGQTYIDLSTNAPSMVKKIGAAFADKGIAMLDAPVSGGTTGAEAATIAIMVGGDKKVFDDALPVLQSFSANDGKMVLKVTFDVGTNVDIMQVNTQNRVSMATAHAVFDRVR